MLQQRLCCTMPRQETLYLIIPNLLCCCSHHPMWATFGNRVFMKQLLPFHPSSAGGTQRSTSEISNHRLPVRVSPASCSKKPRAGASSGHMSCPMPLFGQVLGDPWNEPELIRQGQRSMCTSPEPVDPVFLGSSSQPHDFSQHRPASTLKLSEFLGPWRPRLCAPQYTTSYCAVKHSQSPIY